MNIFVVHASHRLTDHAAHGDGLVAWGLIKALAARGHSLWVAAPRIDLLTADVPSIKLFELRARAGGKALQLLEYAVRSRILYERLSRNVRFDVIHQMNPVVRGYSFGMFGATIPLILGPYIGDWDIRTTNESPLQRVQRRFAREVRYAADKVMQRQASALLITTPYALNRLPGLSEQSEKVHVVPNGIDDRAFAPSRNADLELPAAREILMIGNATHKGVFTMLAAFERLASVDPSARLTIAGGGPQAAEVKTRIDRSPHRERYRLLGSVERQDMPRVIGDASIVCVPSFGEPFGMIVLEAMASGKPVVATNIGGIPYLLGRESELLFAPGDDASLAAILERLLRDPDLRARTGVRNRKRVLEHFAWEAVAKKMETAYASVVAR